MQKTDKYYHENKRKEEEQQHWRKIASGEEIRIGENYRGITARDGQVLEEDVKALAYEDGTVLLGSLDGITYIWIDDDVACVEGSVYTGGKATVIVFKNGVEDIIRGAETEEEKVWRLRKGASWKMFWPLSEQMARMVLSAVSVKQN